jgi:phosphohistidine swiveling domain-containing protein
MLAYRPLSEISFQDILHCGGKAARLGEAMRLGCPVLPGVVLGTDLYHRFMKQGGLQGEITSILSTMQPTAITHFQAVEWAIHAAFDVRRMPDEVSAAIVEAFRSFNGVPVAVRSSATSEDSPQQSFVGQHATFLDVSDERTAIDAVVGCWKSLFSAKALAYAQHFNVDLLSSSMAVIMQPMISPDEQGVLFTVDPITGNADIFVLEIASGPHAGLYELSPYERQAGEQETWGRLRNLGLQLDEHWLTYQAIEWAQADGELFLLRVRPVAVAPPYVPDEGIQIAGGRGPLELVRPHDQSLRALRPFSWYHRSRSPGLNATYFRHTSPLFESFSGREEYYLSGYLYTRWRRYPTSTSDDEISLPRRAIRSFSRLRAARSLDREFRAIWREYRPRLEALAAIDLSSLSNKDLADGLHEVIAIDEAFWAQCGRLGNSPQALRDILNLIHREWVGDRPSCDDLLWAASDQRSRALELLDSLARAHRDDAEQSQRAFREFIARHHHLYLQGRPLAEWHDIADTQVDESEAHAEWDAHARDNSPPLSELNTARIKERMALERRVLERLSRFRRPIYRLVLRLARRYAPLRVDRQEPLLLCRLLEHDIVMQVGRRLYDADLAEKPDDAFLLGYREIIDWLENPSDHDAIARLLHQRRDLQRRWWRYSPPEIIEEVAEVQEEDAHRIISEEDVMRGRPISPGRAWGHAHVINSLGEATNIMPGEVLVCRELLFELSPLFSMVSAVVAEKGGLLDHASVLAREYGVPTIFGVDGVTRRIRTGEELHVDATQGIITRHHAEQPWDSS